MKKINLLILVFTLLISSLGYSQKKAKYVFLFIGDGMGQNQVFATELYQASLKNKIGYFPLSFSEFPVQSTMTTYSADDDITDSSASATAMATGHKTNNGVVNMDSNLSLKYKTVAEKAKKAGFKIGILSTVSIDHATPACFYAHQKSRHSYDAISMELPESGFDYFAGGGVHHLGKKEDDKSFLNKLSRYGYQYVNSKEAIENLKKGDGKIMAVNPGTYDGKEYYWDIDKKPNSIPLAYLTKKGIELLDNKKGFFMMVEGGKIDWALHSNDLVTAIYETEAFDDAIKEAIKFYKQHKKETLIIVTADHETGGMSLGNNLVKGKLDLKLLQYQKISAQEFERKLSVLKKENREISFDEVLDLVKKYFGLGDKEKGLELNNAEKKWLMDAYKKEFQEKKEINPDRDYLDQYEDKPFTLRVITILNNKAGISWSTEEHSASPVSVSAMGVGQDYFKSGIDNTDIYKLIMQIMHLPNKN